MVEEMTDIKEQEPDPAVVHTISRLYTVQVENILVYHGTPFSRKGNSNPY